MRFFTRPLYMLYNYNMNKKFVKNDEGLEYIFEQKNVKNINIRVRRDGSIYVSAPFGVPVKKVEEFVHSKAADIIAAVSNVRNVPPFLTDGSTVHHLGKPYTVKYISGKVTLTDDEIFIPSESAFYKWEKEKASAIITDVCKRLYPLFEGFCPVFPEIRFRRMVSKWGVCRPLDHKITFNTALVRTPTKCIEYVVYHEFVHFLHPDHSKRFYDTLSRLLPDWKERKETLGKFTN